VSDPSSDSDVRELTPYERRLVFTVLVVATWLLVVLLAALWWYA
jgi:hypothetical protein